MAAAGMEPDIWHKTPAEILLQIEVFQRRRAWPGELAWLAGQYAAIGILAPRRYPRTPRRAACEKAMCDEDMQRMLTRIAEGRNRFDA